MMYDIFDGHCDTMYELISNYPEDNIIKNRLNFNVRNTLDYNSYIQILALWANPEYKGDEAVRYMKSLTEKTLKHIDEYNITLIKNKEDLKFKNGFKALLGIEGADSITSNEDIEFYYNKGIRCITLTWNGKNKIGSGALSEDDKGLTEFGFKAINKMNELGIAIDVSHLNEAGFYDVLKETKKPVIASHSCSYALTPHKRNLKDEQFKMLIENKGVCGINFCKDFLTQNEKADLKDIISHIEHFFSLGGEKNVGLGSDFDGIPSLPCKIESNKDMNKILNELLKLNYTEEQVKDVAFNNLLNCFFEIL